MTDLDCQANEMTAPFIRQKIEESGAGTYWVILKEGYYFEEFQTPSPLIQVMAKTTVGQRGRDIQGTLDSKDGLCDSYLILQTPDDVKAHIPYSHMHDIIKSQDALL